MIGNFPIQHFIINLLYRWKSWKVQLKSNFCESVWSVWSSRNQSVFLMLRNFNGFSKASRSSEIKLIPLQELRNFWIAHLANKISASQITGHTSEFQQKNFCYFSFIHFLNCHAKIVWWPYKNISITMYIILIICTDSLKNIRKNEIKLPLRSFLNTPEA